MTICTPHLSDRHGYDGPRGIYAYGQHALIDSPTLYLTPGFLKEPQVDWTVEGFKSTLLFDVSAVLVRHVDPVRVWRLTGNFDAPYPGLFAYQAVWPD
jgi:hypothetical protein